MDSLPFQGIDHIAFAVKDLAEFRRQLETGFGARYLFERKAPEEGYTVAYFLVGESLVFTLLEPLSEESFIAKFLQDRGPGVHHVAVAVKDLDGILQALEQAGVRVAMKKLEPGPRREIVIHPKSGLNLLWELIEWEGGREISLEDRLRHFREGA